MVHINTSEIFIGNPFENNPHLKFISPYKELYERDKSKDKRRASDEFYAVWVLMCPDEETNKWLKLSEDKRKEIVEANIKINWKDKLLQECIDDFPSKCQTLAEVTLTQIRDKLIERDKFLKSNPYTNDTYMRDDYGNIMKAGNTLIHKSLQPKEIDAMIKLTPALYKELAEAEKMFKIEKDNLQIRGGRMPTDIEDGSLFKDYDIEE